MPKPNPGESEQDYISRFVQSDEARRDYPDEKQRAAVAYSMFKEQANASQICRECGGSAGPSDRCATCGAPSAPETPAIETLRNLCVHCLHPLEPEHDAVGCRADGCNCTAVGGVIRTPEDALPNATDPISVGHGWDGGSDPKGRRDIGGKDLDGNPRTAAPGEKTHKIPPPPEKENAGDIHPSKRRCTKCDFVGYPEDVVQHLQRSHGASDDEAHDQVAAPENSNGAERCALCGHPATATLKLKSKGGNATKLCKDCAEGARQTEGEVVNAGPDPAKLCRSCLSKAGGDLDGKEAVKADDGTWHIVQRADGGHWAATCGEECCNSAARQEHQNVAPEQSQRAAALLDKIKGAGESPDQEDLNELAYLRDKGVSLPVWAHKILDEKVNANVVPKHGPFDQPNDLGCNGCDDIRAPLNKDGYCQDCASEQGNTGPLTDAELGNSLYGGAR